MIHKAHVIRLYPTKAQDTLLKKSCGVARYSYNWALAKWEDMYKNGEKPSAYTLIKHQNSIKREETPFFLEVSKCAPQYAIHDLESAYKHYFRKLKDGTIEKQKNAYIAKRLKKGLPLNDKKLKSIGKPKFKKKGKSQDSFLAVENCVQFKQSDFKIQLPRIGKVKCAENLRFEGKIINVVVKRIADKWFAVVNVELAITAKPSTNENQVVLGVDVGIKDMLITSNGDYFENPKALKKNLGKLKRYQRSLSRKQEGSKNRFKQQMKVARLHYKIGCIRKYAIHKATTSIVESADVIVLEDLNVSGILKNHNLAQAVSDVSFYEIRRQIEYKAKWAGKQVIIADRFYPSSKTCSCCEWKNEELKLSDRIFKCKQCNLELDRDLNAAINLKRYGTLKVSES